MTQKISTLQRAKSQVRKEQTSSSPTTRTAILLGSGLFGAQLMWILYNTYMPIFLQSGSSGFNTSLATAGFGLSATITGFIMTLDNIAAFFLQPLMGPLSDRTQSRYGRRKPYILIFAPLSALAFALIPVGVALIPEGMSGQTANLGRPLALMLGSAVTMVLCMALWRTPLFALLPDIFPSEQRSRANAIVNIMSGIGGILAFIAGGVLFGIHQTLPFFFGALMTILAVVILAKTIREPAAPALPSDSKEGFKVFSHLASIPQENKRSLMLLIAAVFFYMVGYMALEAFFSSFAVMKLQVAGSMAAVLLAVSYISFLIFAMPASTLAKKFGRKTTVAAGLLIFAAALLAIALVPTLPVVVAMLAIGGFGWALVNINCYPMILDSSTSESLMGTYSGLYFIATTLAGTAGPILNGWIIDLSGKNFLMIFIIAPVFFVLSFLCIIRVKTGEVKTGA